MNKKRILTSTFKYILLSIFAIVSIFPFYWMIIASTNSSVEVTRGTLIPGTYFINNLKNLINSDLGYIESLKNSAIIAILTTTLAMVISSPAGYAFEVFKSKGKDKVFGFLLLSMMVPFSALMVPLFRLFSQLSKTPFKMLSLNTMGSIISINVATAFLIFFFRQNTKAFPKDLLEAARIDGLGEFKAFVQIFIPTMKTSYAAAIVITFMSSWNNFMWPLIALQSPEKRTVPLIISALGSSYTPDYGVIMTAIVIATLPTALVFFIMQKYFVQGMLGSVKG